MRKVRAYWWNRFRNFGDELTPLLLQTFGYEVERAEPADAEVCVIGSVLELLGPDYAGAVIGSGFIGAGPPAPMPSARFLAIRGPLSAERAGIAGMPFGDAGLLCPMLLPGVPLPQTRIGIVPHYRDKDHPGVVALAAAGVARVIDVQRDPPEVLRDIAECEAVLSSSLHGLIAADAFGRRSAWLKLSDAVIGAGFKFRDYAASIGAEAIPQTLRGDESADDLDALTSEKTFDRHGMQRDLSAAFRAI